MLSPRQQTDKIISIASKYNWEIPEAISQKLAAIEAVTYTYSEAPFGDITADNAEQYVRDYAQHILLTEANDRGVVFDQAKHRLIDQLSRDVLALLRASSDDILEVIGSVIEQAGSQFTDAIKKLPDPVDAETIVARGNGDTLAALSEAKSAAAVLADARQAAAEVLALNGNQVARELQMFAPETLDQYRKIESAFRASEQNKATALERELGVPLVVAARSGVPIKLNGRREAEVLATHLETARIERRDAAPTGSRGYTIDWR